MAISAPQVQALREKTGAGLMDCKRALEQTGGNEEEALRILREKGIASAQKRAGRQASEGVVDAYLHGGGRIGVLIELNCETDFVARNQDFRTLAREIAMQVAAHPPTWISAEEVPEERLQEEREILRAAARNEGRPEAALDRIVEGRLQKWFEAVVLLEQPYIRDDKRKVKDLVNDAVAKIGERIVVRRFTRYQVGEKEER
jgi:elongation factor Ts